MLLEAFPDRVEVSVRDEGPGIPEGRLGAAAAEGRLGVAESIRGRIADLGGTAGLHTGPGGTEWELSVPRVTIHTDHPFADAEPDPVRRFRGRLGGAVTLWTAGSGDDRAGLTVTSLMVANGEEPRLLALLDPDSDLLAELRRLGPGGRVRCSAGPTVTSPRPSPGPRRRPAVAFRRASSWTRRRAAAGRARRRTPRSR